MEKNQSSLICTYFMSLHMKCNWRSTIRNQCIICTLLKLKVRGEFLQVWRTMELKTFLNLLNHISSTWLQRLYTTSHLSPKGCSLLIRPAVSTDYIKLRLIRGYFSPFFPCFWNEVSYSVGQILSRSIHASHLTFYKTEKSCIKSILKHITFCIRCWSKMQNPAQGRVLITFIMLPSGFLTLLQE